MYEAWRDFEEHMDGPPFIVSALINHHSFAKTLLDTGCLSYGLCDSRYARKHGITRIKITPRSMVAFDKDVDEIVDEVVMVSLNIDGHHQEKVFLYVVPQLAGYDMILGMPWFKSQDAFICQRRNAVVIQSSGIVARNISHQEGYEEDHKLVSAAAFTVLSRRKRSPAAKRLQVFSVTMADIQKALTPKKKVDPKTVLPPWFFEWLDTFDATAAEKLPPLRGDGVDHGIDLEKVDGKTPQAPWGPLYNMSREELLVLRRTLVENLDKGFIRVSNSPAAAPVLFVKKPGGGLRFCVDYRALNKLTRKDRYPIPLIYETLRNVSRAKWFTKLDVIAAFNKLRIREGDEWLTAFRTRYGLFEWLVTPFGLANAPSTFQKYINWALRDYLDEFCSAYIDDILIYTNGSRHEHREHVKKVLQRMREAGLQLDISKCEFEVQEVKYLGFIIEAGKGIRMDPEKVAAIKEWQAPKTVRGVQGFLGFANFYRRFIQNFSETTLPLHATTTKDKAFHWTPEADAAFEKLKEMFTTAPMLAQFDHDRETIIETDSSGWSTGGTLYQVDDDGLMLPCAFFSKKNNPAECNYPIYDKEMLAIIKCLKEWDAELRSVREFQIRTDHKNLEYFMTTQKLSERQMRWSLALSRYNFTISYIPGDMNARADALSRREQDMPRLGDDRLVARSAQLLRPEVLKGFPKGSIRASPVRRSTRIAGLRPLEAHETVSAVISDEIENPLPAVISDEIESPLPAVVTPAAPTTRDPVSPVTSDEENSNLDLLWQSALATDQTYQEAVLALQQEKRRFPTELKLKVSISECSISPTGDLLYRGRQWVPHSEELRTSIIQGTHDSIACGHPGRESTYAMLARRFFWPGMAKAVRQMVRNCDSCGRNTAWRHRRQGFLKPLPIPDRIWQELSIDFIVDLPESWGCKNIVVVTDRLGKGVAFDSLPNIEAETVAEWFIDRIYRHHGLPRAIVSDRGSQFVGALWKRVCQLLGIDRRLSTAFSPETDGATERMNQTLEDFLRHFVNHDQTNWARLLAMAELAINNRTATSTGVSPFFLSHGYNFEPLDLKAPLGEADNGESPIQKADRMVRKLKEASEWAQASMAHAQQLQEETTNRSRDQSSSFQPGDRVWLNLENIKTNRPAKKLDAKHAKYTVKEVISSHNYRLDTPPGIKDVFHTRLLKLAATDPLPSQVQDDSQPGPVLLNEEEEYGIEEICDEKGTQGRLKYLVKWTGHARPTWEPASALDDTLALDKWEIRKSNGHTPLGGRRNSRQRKSVR